MFAALGDTDELNVAVGIAREFAEAGSHTLFPFQLNFQQVRCPCAHRTHRPLEVVLYFTTVRRSSSPRHSHEHEPAQGAHMSTNQPRPQELVRRRDSRPDAAEANDAAKDPTLCERLAEIQSRLLDIGRVSTSQFAGGVPVHHHLTN